MILSYNTLLTRKAEYLAGRALTGKETKRLLRQIKVGNNKEIRVALTKIKLCNAFSTISEIVHEHSKRCDLSKLSKEELVSVVEDIVVRTASVQAGLKILRKAGSMEHTTLLKYIFDLYLRDAMSRDRVKKANRAPITLDQAHIPERVNQDLANDFTYENPDKENSLIDVKEYEQRDGQPGYLRDEFRCAPSHNEPKQNLMQKLKNMFKPKSTKDTGGSENAGNAKN